MMKQVGKSIETWLGAGLVLLRDSWQHCCMTVLCDSRCVGGLPRPVNWMEAGRAGMGH